MTDAVTQLIARYAEISRLTALLREALEADRTEALDALADERAAALSLAERALAALSAGPGPSPLASAQIKTAVASALDDDQRLRALLAARAQELPRQLAELRSARAGLGGYQATAVNPQESDGVDRRG